MASFFYDPRPQFLDDNGDPLANGTISFYDAGGTTLQTIYSDAALTIPLSNPLTLSASGRVPNSGIWLAEAHYRLWVKDANGLEISNVPDFVGTGIGAGAGTGVVSTLDALRNLDSGAYAVVHLQGYYTAQDGGGGWFYWKAGAADADNAGTVITPNSSPVAGRWLRSLPPHEPLTPMAFGVVGDGATTVLSNILSMIDWMDANRKYASVLFPAGDYQINGDLTFPAWLNVTIAEGCKFSTSSTSGTVTFECSPIMATTSEVFEYPGINGLFNAPIPFTDPAWWGVDYGAAADQALMLTRAATGTGDNIMRPLNAMQLSDSNATISCRLDVSAGAYFAVTTPGTLELQNDIIGNNDTTVFYSDAADLITITKAQDVRAAWFGVLNNNSTDNATALGRLRDAVYAAGARIVYPPSGVCRIASAYTDAHSGGANNKITHYIPLGGKLRIYGTPSVTIRRVVSGRWSCLTLDAGATWNGFAGAVYPEWFGALGLDGTSDNTALESCARLMQYGSASLEGSGNPYFVTSSTLTIGYGPVRNCDFRMDHTTPSSGIQFANHCMVSGCSFVSTSGSTSGQADVVVYGDSVISGCYGGDRIRLNVGLNAIAVGCNFIYQILHNGNNSVAVGNKSDSFTISGADCVQKVAIGNCFDSVGVTANGANVGDLEVAYNVTDMGTTAQAGKNWSATPRTGLLFHYAGVPGTVNLSSVVGCPANAKIKSVQGTLLDAYASPTPVLINFNVGDTSFTSTMTSGIGGGAVFQIEVY